MDKKYIVITLLILILIITGIFYFKNIPKTSHELNPIAKVDTVYSAENLNSEGKYQDALSIFKTYLSNNPKDINATAGEGVAYFGLGQCHTAMVIFSQAMDMVPAGELLADQLSSTTLRMFNNARNNAMTLDKCD